MRRGSRIEVPGSHGHITAGRSRFENGSGELYDLATGPIPRTRRRVDGEWDDPTWLQVEVDEGWFDAQVRKADEEERREERREQAKEDRRIEKERLRIEDTRRRLARLEAHLRQMRTQVHAIRAVSAATIEAVASALVDRPDSTAMQISALVGRDDQYIREALKTLEARGVVTKIKANPEPDEELRLPRGGRPWLYSLSPW